MGGNRDATHPDLIPVGLGDEINRELLDARRALAGNDLRVTTLEDLLDIVRTLETELRRPATLLDLLSTSGDRAERARRATLPSERP